MKKLAIIPAFNEQESIKKTVLDIKKHAKGFDYIIINDCSDDSTMGVCQFNGFDVINLPINLGIGGAVQTGYLYAYENGYDVAVQFDGDGQHDAKYLNDMADYLEQHELDMLIGSRFLKREGFQSSAVRRLGIQYFTFLIRLLTGKKITDPTSGFRMVNQVLIRYFASEYPKDYPEPESVMAVLRLGRKVEEYPVKMREREQGVSSISVNRSIYYMIKVSIAILIERIRGKKMV